MLGIRIARLLHWQALREASRSFTFEPDILGSWFGEILILSSQDDKETVGKIKELKIRYPKARIHIFGRGSHHTPLLFLRPLMR